MKSNDNVNRPSMAKGESYEPAKITDEERINFISRSVGLKPKNTLHSLVLFFAYLVGVFICVIATFGNLDSFGAAVLVESLGVSMMITALFFLLIDE